jgi:uncharacterized glyoxalase superfamily protein PhnB
MSSRLNPYLTFNGNARQAMEFYANVFGGNLAETAMRRGATGSRSTTSTATVTVAGNEGPSA